MSDHHVDASIFKDLGIINRWLEHMKQHGLLVCIVFILLGVLFSGCIHSPSQGNGLDSRLFGDWQPEEMPLETLSFYPDGTYHVSEGETENWSTSPDGRLWMFDTLYSYALLENDTVLTLIREGYTRIYRKI